MIWRAYSAVCGRPGMMPGWKLRMTRALASRSRTESWTAARPLLSLMRKAASWAAASASASSTARRSPVMRVAPAQAATPGENGLSAFGPGDGGLADPGGLGQVPARQPGQHASAAQLGGELVAPGTGRTGRCAGHFVSAFS